MENQMQTSANPLKKYFRQPKLYLKLPSSGNFYTEGALEKTDNGEYPVFPMTARDEITMKTPDALLNGQSTVEIIQSCMPNIKNAWAIPTIDLDAILIAIRVATYGEKVDLEIRLPNTDIVKEYTADLRQALDKLLNAAFDTVVEVNESITAYIKPLNYESFSKNSLKSLEEQRIFNIVNSQELSDDQKMAQFNKSFKILTDITISNVAECLVKIVTPDGEVSDPAFIKEFIDNADKEFFTNITKHLELQRDKFQMPMFKIETTEEERAQGAPESFESPIVLDASNFFV
jgi:hemerythrin-like domain-containing protein